MAATPIKLARASLAQVTGSITASAQSVTATGLDGYPTMTIQISGTYATGASLQFEASLDAGTTWVSVNASRLDLAAGAANLSSPAANTTQMWTSYLSGCTQFRVRCSAWAAPTGSISIIIQPSTNGVPTQATQIAASAGGIMGAGTTVDGASAPSNPLAATAYTWGWNGTTFDRLRTLGAAGDGLGVLKTSQPPSTPVSQSATHAANTITVAAVASQQNRLTHLSGSISGSGTMPTAAAPLTLTVKDGSTVILAVDITQGGMFNVNLPPGGIKGTTNTAMTAAFIDGGANVTTTINVATLTS